MSILDTRNTAAFAGVFVQTNEQGTNRVLAFRRAEDGALEPAGEYPTGGAGLGAVHLGSQGSVTLTAAERQHAVGAQFVRLHENAGERGTVPGVENRHRGHPSSVPMIADTTWCRQPRNRYAARRCNFNSSDLGSGSSIPQPAAAQ